MLVSAWNIGGVLFGQLLYELVRQPTPSNPYISFDFFENFPFLCPFCIAMRNEENELGSFELGFSVTRQSASNTTTGLYVNLP